MGSTPPGKHFCRTRSLTTNSRYAFQSATFALPSAMCDRSGNCLTQNCDGFGSLSMSRMLKSILALPIILLLFGTAPAQPRRAMMPADILRVASLSDAEVSPDGEWVVYTVSTTDGNQTGSTLWLVRPGERFFRIPPSGRPLEQRRSPETP